jgi:8-oxo-dGTP pyrophosphatase MutT (NUDIX family)
MTSHQYIVNIEAVLVRNGKYLMIVRGEDETHAPGALAFVGGKVENAGITEDILEGTLRREILEEVNLEVGKQMEYLNSNAFITDAGEPVIDIVFLCFYKSGTPRIIDQGEVAAILWMTAEELISDDEMPPWIIRSIKLAEIKRVMLER